ncbi:MAG: hypothetical protein CL943_02010 [Candidatus Diapherotrites archaeon]|uniref:Uncharacterized protein n=1 Tax=Candidatus Iainarchaeum sp. TaxID=3101447 RepID=A0A2D6M0Y8_9ARCH|nr:hypothetical protein [Candidatus Diapherotrites archaeon]
MLLAALFFLWYDYAIASFVFVVLAAIVLIYKPAKSFAKESVKEMEESEGQVPDKSVWEEGLKTAGARVGEQTFSDKDDTTNLKAINVTRFKLKPKESGNAAKKVIEMFKKLFD